MIEAHVQAGLFACFAARRCRELLAAIDVATGKDPEAITWLDRAPDQHDLFVAGANDRSDGNLRIEVDDVSARCADRPLRIRGLQSSRLERRTAGRAISINRIVHGRSCQLPAIRCQHWLEAGSRQLEAEI